jgi:predicted RNA-binding Zn-ribbon protein involved in translation (DUF1610 family)
MASGRTKTQEEDPVFVFACSSCNIKLYRWTPTSRSCPGCGSPLVEKPLPQTARLPRTPRLATKTAKGAGTAPAV